MHKNVVFRCAGSCLDLARDSARGLGGADIGSVRLAEATRRSVRI